MSKDGNAAGKEERQQVLDPCLPQGYDGSMNGVKVSGGGYFSLCRQVSSGLVAGNCTAQHCGLGGLHLPPLSGKPTCLDLISSLNCQARQLVENGQATSNGQAHC